MDRTPSDELQLDYAGVFARHGMFMSRLFLQYQPPPGKSRLAADILCDMLPGQRPYKKDGATEWWDGYRFQTGVLIDDFGGDPDRFSTGQPTIDHVLRWTD
jgi:hypothetical protein